MARSETRELFLRQIINMIAFLAVVVISIVGASVPFNNNYLMDVVARYNPDFMVPSYVYYVFGVVFSLSLLVFAIYQVSSKRLHDKMIRSIDYPFWILAIGHVAFTFAFFYDVQWLAFIGMLVQTVSLFYIFVELGIGKTQVTKTVYWCVHFPFSILTAATIFNMVAAFAMFCIRYNFIWWGVNQTAWTVCALLVVGFVCTVILHYRTDIAFGTVLVWFTSGIVVYQNGHDPIIIGFAYLLTFYFAYLTYHCMKHPRISGRKDTK